MLWKSTSFCSHLEISFKEGETVKKKRTFHEIACELARLLVARWCLAVVVVAP